MFLSLGCLEKELNALVEKAMKKTQQNAEKALDIQHLNQSSSPFDKTSKTKGCCFYFIIIVRVKITSFHLTSLIEYTRNYSHIKIIYTT